MGKRKTSAIRTPQESSTRNFRNKRTNHHPRTNQNQNNVVDFVPNNRTQKKTIELIPQSRNQEKYIVALTDPEIDVVVASGPAGTGKSYLATMAAIQAYRNREVNKIVICRPSVSIENESHGFLPGDLSSKMAPWVRPITDILKEFYSVADVEYMVSNETIEFCPIGFVRGRTFKKSFVIVDESQNCSPLQLKSLLSRIGEGSKYVICGDTKQTDRENPENGLADLAKRINQYPIAGVRVCDFDKSDIHRHSIIEHFLKMYGDED